MKGLSKLRLHLNNYQFSSKLYALVLLLLSFAVFFGPVQYWFNYGQVLVPGRRLYLLSAAVALLAGLIIHFLKKEKFSVDPRISALGLIFIFISSWLHNDYALLHVLDGRGLLFLIFTLGLGWRLLIGPVNLSLIALSLLCFLVAQFLLASDGQIISSDDHMTFLHRLQLLKSNLPVIPNYDALWNAGYDQRYYFATGALAFYAFSYPLLAFFAPETVYNFCVALVTLVLPFFSAYFATWLLSKHSRTSWIAAILALAVCTEWYRWSYQYGTMGFICSASLFSLVVALSIRAINPAEKFAWYYALLLVVTASLMFFWTVSALALLPLIAVAVYRFFSAGLLRKNYIVPLIVLLILINLPWAAVFWSVSSVGDFLKSEKQVSDLAISASSAASPQLGVRQPDEPVAHSAASDGKHYRHKPEKLAPLQSLKKLPLVFSNYNCLILIFALPGLFLTRTRFKFELSVVLLWLLFMGGFLVYTKPQLELDRMLVFFALLASIPAAIAINLCFEERKNCFSVISAALVAAFLIATPLSASRVFNQRSNLEVFFATDFSAELVSALKQYSRGGRVLFSGCVIHEIDGGHLAPFTELAGVPLIASSPVHNLWWYKQVFPEQYLARSDQGITDYLNNYNVSTVMAHERIWRNYFEDRPEQFTKVVNIGRFKIYQRNDFINNYIFDGSAGRLIEQDNHGLLVRAESDPLKIKFRYFDFLTTAGNQCQVSATTNDYGEEFIKLSACASYPADVRIEAKPAWKRIKLNKFLDF